MQGSYGSLWVGFRRLIGPGKKSKDIKLEKKSREKLGKRVKFVLCLGIFNLNKKESCGHFRNQNCEHFRNQKVATKNRRLIESGFRRKRCLDGVFRRLEQEKKFGGTVKVFKNLKVQ